MTHAEETAPFPEDGQPIRKMIHRIDTEKGIEGVIGKR
jgi:hypothetical protein